VRQTDEKKPGIPQALEDAVLAKAGENWSVRRISDWLETDHGVSTSPATVARLIAKYRAERAATAKQVAREQLSRGLTSDLDRLEQIRAECERRASCCSDDKDWGRLIDLEVKVIDRKLHYAGVGPDTESVPTIVLEWPDAQTRDDDTDTAN